MAKQDNSTLTARQAVEQVLAGKRSGLSVSQITDAALPLTALKGKTPKQQFYSLLYSETKKADGLVVKAGDGGVFKLNPKRKSAAKPAAAKTPAATSKRSSAKPAAAKA
jgi:HB1, ASXL, restriction endonuclease HTH domain